MPRSPFPMLNITAAASLWASGATPSAHGRERRACAARGTWMCGKGSETALWCPKSSVVTSFQKQVWGKI